MHPDEIQELVDDLKARIEGVEAAKTESHQKPGMGHSAQFISLW